MGYAHLSRILRELRMGNLMIYGMAAQGRQTLTKLATFCIGMSFIRIEVSKHYSLDLFRKSIKSFILEIGIKVTNA